MSYKPNLTAHMPAAALNAAGSVHSPSTSMATSSQYRQLLSDYGPPSLGYTQAWAQERDRRKKQWWREDGLKHCTLAMQQSGDREARPQHDEAEQPDRDRPGLEARRQRRQRRKEEQARALQRELAALMQLCKEKDEEQEAVASAHGCTGNPASLTWGTGSSQVPQSKYAELLAIIEELGKEIRPTYAGSKSAMERLKRGIIHARGLVRECLAETERNARS